METRLNAMRTICNLVVHFEPARKLAVDSDIVPALGVMLKLLSDEEEKMIMAKIMRAISFYGGGHVTIQDSKGMNILLRLSKMENAELKSDVSIALLNLSTCMFTTQLIEDGVIEAIFWLTLQDLLGLTKPVNERCSAVIRNLTGNSKSLGRVVLPMSWPPWCAWYSTMAPCLVRRSRDQPDAAKGSTWSFEPWLIKTLIPFFFPIAVAHSSTTIGAPDNMATPRGEQTRTL